MKGSRSKRSPSQQQQRGGGWWGKESILGRLGRGYREVVMVPEARVGTH